MFRANIHILFLIIFSCPYIGVRGEQIKCSNLYAITSRAERLSNYIVDEILRIPHNGVFQENLLQQYDSRSAGESIVRRLYQKEKSYKERFGSLLKSRYDLPYDLFKESEIHLRFQEVDLENVLSAGILNLHQTGKSNANYAPDRRVEFEDKFIQIKLGTGPLANQLRPKYAVVDLTRNANLGKFKEPLKWYGNIVAVLKDEVKKRATWTEDDSFENYTVGPKTFYTDTFNKLNRGTYVEAQIWGELDIRDFDHFLINGEISFENLNKLKEVGLPIYAAKLLIKNNRYRSVKVEQLYTGNPEKIAELQQSLEDSRRSPPVQIMR